MRTYIKVRGIYSTALTKLLLDCGYGIGYPSSRICERFGMEPNEFPFDISVSDAEDFQGIELYGGTERVSQFITFFQDRLLDAVLLELIPEEDTDETIMAGIELPGASKQLLDEIRRSVLPTVSKHHRFQIIGAGSLDQIEAYLRRHPEKQEFVDSRLFNETILLPLEKRGTARLEHIRPSGKALRPREGRLLSIEGNRIVFRRSFYEGRYDGLDITIQPGDYGLTEIKEGQWYIKHTYFRRNGEMLGEYFNINTPVELYPYGARYLDLEIDIIRRAGEEPFIIDQEKLSLLAEKGCIGTALEAKALEVAECLMQSLRS
ncbi:MAG: DUF402 domain-containing protein [Syntrophobacteraceae bacterium]